MNRPRLPSTHPDRHLECQEVLEPHVIAIVDEGIAAGWSIEEVTAALVALADNAMLAHAANGDTDRQIAAALARLRDG